MVVYEEAGKVKVEHDPGEKLFAIHWSSLNGPHYRKAVDLMVAAMKEHGVRTYISDSSAAKDVQTQEDLAYLHIVAQQIVEAGAKVFIAVTPASAIAKMGANKVAKAAEGVGVQRHAVATYEEALKVARGAKAA
jgi:hypothetical protein